MVPISIWFIFPDAHKRTFHILFVCLVFALARDVAMGNMERQIKSVLKMPFVRVEMYSFQSFIAAFRISTDEEKTDMSSGSAEKRQPKWKSEMQCGLFVANDTH